MPKVVSIINLKGGVGKTTTTVQLAECLVSEFGKRVLVVDLDPQTNATIALVGEDRWDSLDKTGKTLPQLFVDKLEGTSRFDINTAILQGASNLKLRGLSLLASSMRFIDVQDRIMEIATKSNYTLNPMQVLQSALRDHVRNYDYVLIDCPPNLGLITQNGLEISDSYLIPTIPDVLSTYGIPQIVVRIANHARTRSLKIRCLGLLVTKYMTASAVQQRCLADLPFQFKQAFDEARLSPAPVFKTKIPQANVIAAAVDFDACPKTFRQKYGHQQAAGVPLYEYVVNFTQEFMHHAGT